MLRVLPPKPGVAVVLVQHLAPQHDSALPTLLTSYTSMPVVQVKEGMRVERNHVYVIPPNVQMGLTDGHFHLRPRPDDRTQYTPIDSFLASLAEHAKRRAIGVILSGTASDGAMGVREIKGAGGIIFVQKPETAKYDGMPRAAIATGMADMILPPPEIALKLTELAAHPTFGSSSPSAVTNWRFATSNSAVSSTCSVPRAASISSTTSSRRSSAGSYAEWRCTV